MPPPKKPPAEIEDEFTKMTAQELTQNLQIFKDKVNELKQKRNYIQMDRDMVQNFLQNCLQEIQELQIKIVNKETEAEQLEEQHRVQIKSYEQKVIM